jgi:hypothetical protein
MRVSSSLARISGAPAALVAEAWARGLLGGDGKL